MHVVERYAAWAADWRARPIPPEVAHHARRAVIDWHAALYPGTVVAPATLLKKALAANDARTVALINGAAAHTVEVDDIYRDGIYHPGAPTIAAAHALGFERPNFLRAVIVGYEISTRIGAAMGRAHYRYWHNTGTIGCFGAAAAAAEILKLSEKQFAHALATVATFAAALQQAFRMDSMSKPLHAGRAAEAGVTAALAAREGVTGSLDIIEGEAGFGRAMGDNPDWERALAGLGRDFHITRMTFKNHACCGHTFAAIDGALALKARMGVQPAEIDRIDVGTYRAGVEVAHYAAPPAFEPPRLNDPATRALMAKVAPSVDAELDATFPSQRAARVAITARGRREELLQPTRKGDPDLPLTDAELEDKYMELAAPVIGRAAAQELLARLWRLECA
ncbi:MAG: MmgE/PrpD family protein [Betaproteobacteria bacterium]|nr:MAG: MmgE/PrpD family protein [Betaproteobacteria bacterium]